MGLLSVRDASEYIGVAEVTMRRYIKSNKIPFVKVGGLYKFKAGELDVWMGRTRAITPVGSFLEQLANMSEADFKNSYNYIKYTAEKLFRTYED